MSGKVRIIRWHPDYRDDFVRLNKAWIERFFRLEPGDLRLFADPEVEIIRPGGEIFFAQRDDGRIVGCCALVFHPETGRYELAKMAVDVRMQGRGIGFRLGTALLEYACERHVGRIFLEANTRLAASVALYRKLGFRESRCGAATYERCNLVMEYVMDQLL